MTQEEIHWKDINVPGVQVTTPPSGEQQRTQRSQDPQGLPEKRSPGSDRIGRLRSVNNDSAQQLIQKVHIDAERAAAEMENHRPIE